jgi:hypothetical protein
MYSEPNLTAEEIQTRTATKHEDPLHDFSNICRAELEVMQKQLRKLFSGVRAQSGALLRCVIKVGLSAVSTLSTDSSARDA